MVLVAEIDILNGPEVIALMESLKGKARKAVFGAFKDVAKSVRTTIAREVTKRIKVPYGLTLKRIRVQGPSLNNLAMRIHMDEKNKPGLMSFGAKQARKGVSYKIEKSGKRGFIRSAFIRPGNTSGLRNVGKSAIGTSGPNRVFIRISKSPLPIRDLKGPSLNAVVTKNDIDAAQKKVIETKLPERILARLRLADSRSR